MRAMLCEVTFSESYFCDVQFPDSVPYLIKLLLGSFVSHVMVAEIDVMSVAVMLVIIGAITSFVTFNSMLTLSLQFPAASLAVIRR